MNNDIEDLSLNANNEEQQPQNHEPKPTESDNENDIRKGGGYKSFKLPRQTAEIFNVLSKGNFICSNASKDSGGRLYDALNNDENQENLTRFFALINYRLEKGNNYFYFTKRDDGNAILEKKLESFEKYIDIIDLFSCLDNKVTIGARFRPSELYEECISNVRLKQKLQKIPLYRSETMSNKMKEICELLTRDSFLEKEDEVLETYKVLDSYSYLLDLINAIAIYEDPNAGAETAPSINLN